MTDRLPAATVRAWGLLHRASNRALAAVEVALKAADLPPLGWYDVLLELDRTKGGRLAQANLERRLLLAQYNLSRLLDRMADRGLVTRQPSAADGRAVDVAITRAGRALRRRMWPIYRDALRGAFVDRLDPTELSLLSTLLEPIARAPDG